MNFHGYGTRILEGALITLEVALLSLVLALILGLATAAAKLSRNALARGLATAYTTVIRGVPDLVLMLLIFFGGQMGINAFTDWLYDRYGIDIFINVDEFTAGIFTIGFIFGAYMSETFRGAFLAVDKGLIEAGMAIGMSRTKIFHRIQLPLLMRHALPGLGNNWLVLLKTTALISVIGLSDMVRVAAEASKAVQEPFTFFIPVALIYLLIASLSELGIKYLERHYNTGFERGV